MKFFILLIFLLTSLVQAKVLEFDKWDSKKVFNSLIEFSNNRVTCENENCTITVSSGCCAVLPFSGTDIEDSICEWDYEDNHRPYGAAERVEILFNFLYKNHIHDITNEYGTIFLFFESVSCEKTKRFFGDHYSCNIEISDENIKY